MMHCRMLLASVRALPAGRALARPRASVLRDKSQLSPCPGAPCRWWAATAAAAAAGSTAAAASSRTEAAEQQQQRDPFDWNLGLLLAGAAFESYNSARGGVPHLAPNGACTTHLDRRACRTARAAWQATGGTTAAQASGGGRLPVADSPQAPAGAPECKCREFLMRRAAGLLEVTVQSATGLPAADVSARCSSRQRHVARCVRAFMWQSTGPLRLEKLPRSPGPSPATPTLCCGWATAPRARAPSRTT